MDTDPGTDLNSREVNHWEELPETSWFDVYILHACTQSAQQGSKIIVFASNSAMRWVTATQELFSLFKIISQISHNISQGEPNQEELSR
jgi:hypothetical protein